MVRFAITASAVGAALVSGCASPQAPTSEGASNPALAATGFTPADSSFALAAASSGLFEVAAGQLAVVYGADPQVREFGQMLVQDHTLANSELLAILAAHGIAPPTR